MDKRPFNHGLNKNKPEDLTEAQRHDLEHYERGDMKMIGKYRIEPKRDFGENPNGWWGWVVTSHFPGQPSTGYCVNAAPGATWFRSAAQARQGVAALMAVDAAIPCDDALDSDLNVRRGQMFHALLHLARVQA